MFVQGLLYTNGAKVQVNYTIGVNGKVFSWLGYDTLDMTLLDFNK